MTWQAVARKDFSDAIRSWWLWGLSGLFILIFTLPVYFIAEGIGVGAQEATDPEAAAILTSDLLVQVLLLVAAPFVPIIAIVIAYAAIAGERDSGTLKLLLSLPHSRADVVAGKLLGRGGVIVLPILLATVLSALVVVISALELRAGTFVQFALLTALLGVVFVAIAVGISAAARTGKQAMIGTVGIYVLFTVLWNSFLSGLNELLSEYAPLGDETLMHLQMVLALANPIEAYRSLVGSISYTEAFTGGEDPTYVARIDALASFEHQLLFAETFETLPAYYSDFAVLVVFVSWIALFPLVGFLVFREEDL